MTNNSDPDAAFGQAAALHRSGRIAEAVALYRQLLQQLPDEPSILSALGMAELQLDRAEAGLALLERSLAVFPQQPGAECNRGLALMRLGRHAQALAAFDRALALAPSFAEAHANRSRTLLALGRAGEALQGIDRAIALAPGNAGLHYNRGAALRALKRPQEAISSYGRAIALSPHSGEAYINRGNALCDLARWEEALADYERAVALAPENANAWYNRGNALKALARFDEALSSYDRAIAAGAATSACWNNRGLALAALERPADALDSYDRAIAANPADGDVHVNRGNALKNLRRLPEALASYDRAVALDPGNPEADWNKALTMLLGGDLAEGWRLYEGRWKSAVYGIQRRTFDAPEWTGTQSLSGKTVLVFAEQGLGDTVQFWRYIPMLQDAGAKVVAEVPERLVSLFSQSEPQCTSIARGAPLPLFDLYCPMLSLPRLFRTTLENVPAAVPYLRLDPAGCERVRGRLGEKRASRVGFVWSGNPQHVDDRRRSMRLEQFEALFALPLEFHCLQKDVDPRERDRLSQHPAIRMHHDDQCDIRDAAALIDAMDLVVTVDTAVAHIAGALGKPTWILLSWVPDWRWMLDRDDSPWYPTVRLFRQHTSGDWGGAVADLCRALASHW